MIALDRWFLRLAWRIGVTPSELMELGVRDVIRMVRSAR